MVENRSIYNLLECEGEFRIKLLEMYSRDGRPEEDADKDAAFCVDLGDQLERLERWKIELGALLFLFLLMHNVDQLFLHSKRNNLNQGPGNAPEKGLGMSDTLAMQCM